MAVEKYHTQRGFSLPLALVAVAAIAVLGVSGWLVYKHQTHTTKPPVADSATTTSPSTTKSESSPTAQPAQTATTYLDITQWGVRLPLSSAIQNAYYVVPIGMATDSDGEPSGVFVSAHALDSACGTLTSDAKGSLNRVGEIVRVQPSQTDPVTRELYTQEYPNGLTINGWYYGFSGASPESSCGNASATPSIVSAYQTATKNAVSDTATSN